MAVIKTADLMALGMNSALADKVNKVAYGASSLPADADVENGQIVFWIDEATNKLKVKLKYAAGTVKVGELALT